VDFDEGVHAVGFARKEGFNTAPLDVVVQTLETGLALRNGGLVALLLAKLYEGQIVVEVALKLPKFRERPLDLLALTHHLLGTLRVVPEVWIFGASVQVGKTRLGIRRVKDAS
jgi:hypothetical protein